MNKSKDTSKYSYQIFTGDGSKVTRDVDIDDGTKMSYGSTNAICTYDNEDKNKCIFMGTEYDMGQMCAH